jgi:hypothetical protein
MGKGIGAAADYYRLRVMHVDESDEPDLEWRDDILYRRPVVGALEEYEMYRVEAVALADEEDVTLLGAFDSIEDAHEALADAEEALLEMTRSEFEERYFPADV